MENISSKRSKTYAICFFTFGLFAIIGSLFSWGKGWLFTQKFLPDVLIPILDLIITFPLSIISSIGLWKNRKFGITIGLVTCGVYLFGSILVLITVVWNGAPNPIHLILPAILGISFSIVFINNYLNKPFID